MLASWRRSVPTWATSRRPNAVRNHILGIDVYNLVRTMLWCVDARYEAAESHPGLRRGGIPQKFEADHSPRRSRLPQNANGDSTIRPRTGRCPGSRCSLRGVRPRCILALATVEDPILPACIPSAENQRCGLRITATPRLTLVAVLRSLEHESGTGEQPSERIRRPSVCRPPQQVR